MTEPACETPLPTILLRSVLWRRTDEPTFELARFREFHDGFILEVDDQGVVIHYGEIWERVAP